MIKLRTILLSILVLPGIVIAYTNTTASSNTNSNVYNKDSQLSLGSSNATPAEKNAAITRIQNYSLEGDYKDAETSLSDYQKRFGIDDAYTTEEARYLALNGNSQDALKLVEPLLKKDPKNSTLLIIKNYALTHSATATATATAISSNPEFPEISPEVQAAEAASDAGDYTKAMLLYKQALSKSPDDKSALIGLARTYLFLENYTTGESILGQYKQKYGEDDRYLTEKARDLAFRDHSQQSLDVLAPLLKKYPSNDALLDIKNYATKRLKSHPEGLKHAVEETTVKTIPPIITANNAAAFARRRGTDANDYAIAAKDYLDANDAKNALVMINDALKLDPVNSKNLLMKAEIAKSLNKKAQVYQAYQQLYAMNPTNPKIILGLARAAGDVNKLDQSSCLYQRYLKMVPNDKKAWLEYAYILSWRGNDRYAVWTLDKYRRRFGDSDNYLAERARILASATRYTESFAVVNRVLPRLPNNYDLNFANTTDFYYNNQPIEMYKSFKRVRAIEPNTDETNGLWDLINTPYRSNIGLEGYYSRDSDGIRISRLPISAQYYLSPLTSFIANVTPERLSAPMGGGLNPIEGGHAISLPGFNIGANHRISPNLALQGLIGAQYASNNQKSFNYEADAFINPLDTLTINLQAKRAFYDLSPRAVSLGVKQNLGQVTLIWQPCLQCYLTVNGQYATFTDTNNMRLVDFSPSVEVISSAKFNVKLGIEGEYFKFAKQLYDGYYNPSNYKYGSGVADIYYKYSDNIGYETSIGLGLQRDETFTSWRAANDYSVKAYYGIYQDWYLVLSGAYSTRGRSIALNPGIGTYWIYAFDAAITRRFG